MVSDSQLLIRLVVERLLGVITTLGCVMYRVKKIQDTSIT